MNLTLCLRGNNVIIIDITVELYHHKINVLFLLWILQKIILRLSPITEVEHIEI